MAAPAGFNDLLNRKYDILSTEATNRGALEQAQATNIAASTPFENALRAAQAQQTSATARTIEPLAAASQAATYAGVGETQARTGLTGAQTGLVGAQTRDITADLGSIGRAGAGYYLDQLRRMGTTYAPGAAAPAATGGTPSLSPQASVLGPTATPGVPVPPVAGNAGIRTAVIPGTGRLSGTPDNGYYDQDGNYIPRLARGTAMVKAPGKAMGGVGGLEGMLAAAKGASRVPGHGSGRVDKVRAVLAPGEAVVNAAGVKHIPGGRAAIAKANAKGNAETDGKPTPKGKVVAPAPAQARPHFVPGQPQQQQPSPSKKMM